MFRAFNMGIGLVMACAGTDAERVRDVLQHSGERGVLIGRIVPGAQNVRYS